MKILVTGGAGFIGSAVVRLAVARGHAVVNLDALTYAADLRNVAGAAESPLYAFERADIRDRGALDRVFRTHQPDAVLHLAAESHVDRSIDGPGTFVRPTSPAPTTCSRRRGRTGRAGGGRKASACTTSRPTRSTARSERPAGSPRRRPTTRARPTRPRRRAVTTLFAHGTKPTGCPPSSPTARTTTGPTTSPRS